MNFSLPKEISEQFKDKKRKPLTKEQRLAVKAKCNGKCAYCGIELSDKFHVDHMDAFYRGGKCEMDNFMPACAKCNNYKLTSNVEEFRELISRQLELASRNSVNYRTALRFHLIQEIKKPVVFYFETLKELTHEH